MSNLTNLPEINQEQALYLAKFFIKSGQNLFLFGRKGTGKTHIAMQAVQECGYKINYINLSVIERSDLAGYPNINSTGEFITYKSPIFLPSLADGSKADTIIIFDEVDKAPPEVTAPLLEILQFKKINGKSINVVSCILTSNLYNENTYSNIINGALLDRGAKYILAFDFEKWVDWAKANNIHDLILGFLRSNPEFACSKIEDSCYASPSPRGWSLASDALIKAKELKIVDIESTFHIISGYVGIEAGLRFKTWYEHYKKFEPYVHSIIEKGIVSIEFEKLSPTEKIVFVITACHNAKQKLLTDINKNTRNKFSSLENLCNFFIQYNVDHELQIIGLYNSFDFQMITKYKLYTCKVFFELFNKMSESVAIKK